jgi:hypothetical protein
MSNKFLLTAILSLLATPVLSVSITLDFEGAGDMANINEFYNGGTDSLGNSGTNYGVSFGANTLSCIDADAGGTCNIANEPTEDTIMFFTSESSVLNYGTGFDTGFSFWYTAAQAVTVDVWSALGATGDLIGTINLSQNYQDNGCVGDPNGGFCNWDVGSLTFAGTAMSIDFGGAANLVGFDNITFGSVDAGTPTSQVPEPTSLALLGLGLAGIGAARRKKSA